LSTQCDVSPVRLSGRFAVPGASGFAGAESVGLGAGFEDVGVEGDPVDDRCDQAGRNGAKLGDHTHVAVDPSNSTRGHRK
jgi:hypothetical protein